MNVGMIRDLEKHNYKIRSTTVYRGTMLAVFAILCAVTIAELTLDMRPLVFLVTDAFACLAALAALFAFAWPQNRWLTGFTVLAMYLLIEARFIVDPESFHVIIFWATLVPLTALIVEGSLGFKVWTLIVFISLIFNYFYADTYVGTAYRTTVDVLPFLVRALIFYGAIFSFMFLLYKLMRDAYTKMKSKNRELEELREDMETKKNRMQRYQLELLRISKDGTLTNSGENQLYKGICKVAADMLGVQRVSIWLMEDSGTALRRKFMYEDGEESDESFLAAKGEYPVYFQALESKSVIVANDARTHADTIEFRDDYLIPKNVHSMLDCPIILDTTTIGVISCESLHEPREWHVEDGLFIQSLADFMAINYKNSRIKKLLAEIASKNKELVAKNVEIGEMNSELHHLNDELTAMNESLEDMVQQRTIELEKQNTKLKEYAFINSHLLRAPVSRILGASQLIETEIELKRDKELLDELISSTNELDAIIHRIGDVLYEGKNLTRQEIEEIIKRNLNPKL